MRYALKITQRYLTVGKTHSALLVAGVAAEGLIFIRRRSAGWRNS